MQQFRLSAWDLNTNTLLTDFTAKERSFSVRLSDSGEASCKVPLESAGVKGPVSVLQGLDGNPFKLIIGPADNSAILYAGIMWQTDLSKKSTTLDLSGKELLSYFGNTVITRNYVTSIDPTVLLQNVVADVQAQNGANLGIGSRLQVSITPPAVVPNYKQAARTTAAQVISDIAAAVTPGTGGIDYTMEHAWVTGPSGSLVPQHTLVVAAPRAGRVQDPAGAFIDLASATDFEWPTDAQAAGNDVFVIGGGSGSAQPQAHVTSSDPIGGLGQMPLLQQVYQYSQVTKTAQLTNIGQGEIRLYGRPVKTPTVELPVDYEPLPLGSFSVGDDVRVFSEPSRWHPAGLNEWWRIVAYTVDIADQGVTTMKLTLNRPPVF